MRRLKRCALALICALAIGHAAAQGGDELLLLDLCVNERCVGIAAVVVRGEAVWVDREALAAAGVDVTDLASERIGDRDYVRADQVNHGAQVRVDLDDLRLDLRLRADTLAPQVVDLRARVPAEIASERWSAFVNYAAAFGDETNDRSLFLDAALGRGGAALRSTAQWSRSEAWQRGLTRFELDQPDQLRRWIVGDQVAVARDALGGGLLLGGFGIERAFEQDPYLVVRPQPFYSSVLGQPGTVEVYANGVLIGRHELAAGPFTLENLGIPPGRNDLQVIVRDPFGTSSVLASSAYYGSSTLLRPGLSDYALRVGVPREDGGVGSGYGDEPVLQTWYRRGLSEHLTLGARFEGAEALQNAGGDAALSTPVGEFALSLAGSVEDAAGRGGAGAITYSFHARHWGLSVGARRLDAAYRNIGEPFSLSSGRLREQDFGAVTWSPFGRFSLQLNASRQRREGRAEERSTGVSGTWSPAPRLQVLASVQRTEFGALHDTNALISLTYVFERENLSLSASRSGDVDGYGVDAHRSRPPGLGWGYDLSLQRFDGNDSGIGQVEYQGRYGRYGLQAERFGDDTRGRLLASGALVGIGGRAYATPPLETGFALVRVPGLADVPIQRENLPVGRTDEHGDLLVRDLLPYYPNRLALDGSQVPLGYEIRTPERAVAVPRNAGSLVVLAVDALHAATGTVRLRRADGEAVAQYGTLVLESEGRRYESLLGRTGRYYFEHLPPGRYVGEAVSGEARARCALDVPERAEPGITDLGPLRCAAEAAAEESE